MEQKTVLVVPPQPGGPTNAAFLVMDKQEKQQINRDKQYEAVLDIVDRSEAEDIAPSNNSPE
ncbi:MAG: hypothetical protein ABEI13_01170 [Candidatus Paceibacteria bacterium]